MSRDHRFIPPSFLSGLAHVEGFASRDLAEPSRHPSLVNGEIDNRFEEFSFGDKAVSPEMLDEEIDDVAILREYFSELVSLFLGGEFERTLGRTLDFHPGILIIPRN